MANSSPSPTQVDRERGVGEGEGRREDLAAAEHARLARDEIGRGGGLRGKKGRAGQVAPGSVLLEGGADDAREDGGCEHQTVSRIGAAVRASASVSR